MNARGCYTRRKLAGITLTFGLETLTLFTRKPAEPGGYGEVCYDVPLSRGTTKLADVTNPCLFSTRYRTPQLKLFALDAFGDGGWLKTLRFEGYAAYTWCRADALQL